MTVQGSIKEPPHDKTNKVAVRPAKTKIILGIHPVLSESSLHADSEDSDQTGRLKTYCCFKRNFVRGGSRNFKRGVHKITVFQRWPLFESLVVASLWNFVLNSGIQPCIRVYGDTNRMKQYSLFWLKIYFDCFNYKIISTVQYFSRIW